MNLNERSLEVLKWSRLQVKFQCFWAGQPGVWGGRGGGGVKVGASDRMKKILLWGIYAALPGGGGEVCIYLVWGSFMFQCQLSETGLIALLWVALFPFVVLARGSVTGSKDIRFVVVLPSDRDLRIRTRHWRAKQIWLWFYFPPTLDWKPCDNKLKYHFVNILGWARNDLNLRPVAKSHQMQSDV